MLSSNMHNQNVRIPFPPLWKDRFTVQGTHPSLPCADPAVQSQAGTTTGHCKGRHMERSWVCWSGILPLIHHKTNLPNWQQGSISKAALPTLPRVRSWTSMFLETERCQILSLLQYKQTASWATKIKDAQFLTDLTLAFCLLFPTLVLTEVTLAVLFYFHPTGDSISPS